MQKESSFLSKLGAFIFGKGANSENSIDIKLTGERLETEKRKFKEIAENTISAVENSGFFKPEFLPVLSEKIRENTQIGYGYIDPFDKTDYLTLEEKKALCLNTRRKYSRELINALTEKGLSSENPNELLKNIFQQNYHKVFRKYELDNLKAMGIQYVEILDCNDERDCKAIKRLKKRWAIDEVPELPLPQCNAKYCRCSYIADEKELFKD